MTSTATPGTRPAKGPLTGGGASASVGRVADAHTNPGTVTDFLDRLAARTPTPAGGAVAALCTAQAAALVAMVARFCGDDSAVERAEKLVARAQELADEDEAAFGDVAAAWALPRRTPEEEAARRSAIDEALLRAAEPQAHIVEIVIEVLVLVDQVRPRARPGIRADLVAAAEVARAGSTIARMNVTSNLGSLPDSEERRTLLRRIGIAQGSH